MGERVIQSYIRLQTAIFNHYSYICIYPSLWPIHPTSSRIYLTKSSSPMGIIKLLESRQELDAVTSTQGLVIIDVYSEPYCRHLSSTYSRLPKKFTHLQFYRIDERIFSGFRQFAKQSNISSIPTILVYCNGQNLVKTAVSSPTLVEMLVEHCDEEYLKSLAMIRHPSCSLSALQASIQLNFLF